MGSAEETKEGTKTPLDIKSALRYSHPQMRLVLAKASTGFKEVRCENCGTLLYKMKGVLKKSAGAALEIRCRKCGELHQG